MDGLGIHDDFLGFMRPSRRSQVRELFESPTISGLSDVVDLLVLINREFNSRATSPNRQEFDL